MRPYVRPLVVTFSALGLACLFSYAAIALTEPTAKTTPETASEESEASIQAKQQDHRAELSAKAEAGDVKAMLDLGLACSVGFGGPIDRPGALKWVRTSAEKGHGSAQYVYGKMLQRGEYLPKDLKEAVRWLRLSAEKGDPDAQLALAEAYANGEGVKADEGEQVRWLRLSAAQGHPLAEGQLGLVLYDQDKPDRWKEASGWFRKAAMQGDTESMFNLGMLHLRGHGVPKDRLMALAWFMIADLDIDDATRQNIRKMIGLASDSDRRLAAKLSKVIMDKMVVSPMFADGVGHLEEGKTFLSKLELAYQGKPEDQFELARLYHKGIGTINDPAEAASWCLKAAKQGHVEAMRTMAITFRDGDGVKLDIVEMAAWFRKAAEKGDAPSQLQLGICYIQGNGVAKDEKQAEFWAKKAAVQGHPIAQSNLGSAILSSADEARFPEALKWLKLSAEQGHPGGMYKYGLALFIGMGCAENRIEGAAWLMLCLPAMETEEQKDHIKQSLDQLTQSERTEAETAAAEIRKKLRDMSARPDPSR
jgi:TPR repeat protein